MKPKVLIVDDEPQNQATLEAFLVGEGYALSFAASGREALDAARRLQPDVILLDVMMPDLNGFDACRAIRSDPEIGGIPIIIVTALDDETSRLDGLRGGADDFLTKPCRGEELRARVRTIVSLNRFRTIANERKRFQQLYELSPSAIVLTDEQGTILHANPLAESMLGQTGLPLAGDALASRLGAGNSDCIRELVTQALGPAGAPPREIPLGTGAGEQVLRVRGAAVPEGDRTRALLIFDNVTEEARARTTLEHLNQHLDRIVHARTRDLQEANALLMSYASFVSHDLRSPLTIVKGYLSMLHQGVMPLNAEAQPIVARAYDATLMMQELIDNILQLAQRECSGDHAPGGPVQPAPIIRRIWHYLDDHQPHARRHFILGDLPDVGVSANVLERVFYNLIGNALKYSAGVAEPRIEVGALPVSVLPTLYVRDNGVGFDTRETDKLFLEFSRLETAEDTEGFGLGLSLVARLVRLHGGRIWAEGAPGHGATFYVEFPSPTAQPGPRKAAGSAAG